MRVKAIEYLDLEEPVTLYDVINASPDNNFLLESNSGHYLVSHNCAVMDEVDFFKGADLHDMNNSAVMKTYTSIKRRIESRFMRRGNIPGKVFLISSKRTENDFLEQYSETQKNNPRTLIIDEPIWNVKPKDNYSGDTFKLAVGNKYIKSRIVEESESLDDLKAQGYKVIDVPVEYRSAFEIDVEASLRDIAGIATTANSKFISFDRLVKNYTERKNPFTSEVLSIGLDDDLEIKQFFKVNEIEEAFMRFPGFVHLDTSLVGDHTGISYVVIAGTKDTKRLKSSSEGLSVEKQVDFVFRQLFTIGIEAPSDSEISFEKTRQFLYYLKSIGFNLVQVSCDGFQSADTIQLLKQAGINTKLHSLDRKPDGYLSFKSAINEQRLDLLDLKGSKLEVELLDLERDYNSGKIDHPAKGSKDEADSLAGAIWLASEYANSDQFRYLESDLTNLTDIMLSDTSDSDQQLSNAILGLPTDAAVIDKVSDLSNTELFDDFDIF